MSVFGELFVQKFKCRTYRTAKMPSLLSKQHNQSGFTLIEVMVALAILATVAIVASQASGTYLRSVTNLKERTLAQFVAQNTAATMDINAEWVQSNQVSQATEQGRSWQVAITPVSVQDMTGQAQVRGNGLDNVAEYIQPVSIQVAPINTDGEPTHSVVDVTVMLIKPDSDQLGKLPEMGVNQ